MKTAELSGAALDWAVAKCELDDKLSIYFDESTGEPLCHDDWPDNQIFQPSTDWAHGGPIIERERIELRGDGNEGWIADDNLNPSQWGPTPLIAAMRCFVASCLGDEVDVPEELK